MFSSFQELSEPPGHLVKFRFCCKVLKVYQTATCFIESEENVSLTYYHTTPAFNDCETDGFRKLAGKRRKCL